MWTLDQKPTQYDTFLLKEDGDLLLQEDEDKIVLVYGETWNETSKPSATTWTLADKPA